MGVFPRRAFIELWQSPTVWTFHSANGQLWFQILLFAVHGFFALWLLVGYRTKIATIFIWILTVSLHNRNMTINSGADDLLRLVLFWSMFLPLDRYWSWDKNRYALPSLTQICTIGTIAFIAQQVFLYWVTAYMKLWPEWYITHSAVYEILSLETFRLPFWALLYTHPGFLRFLSGASMFAEFIGPLLLIAPLFHSRARYLGIIAIGFLHIGILTHIGVGIFPWVSMIALLTFLPSNFWDKMLPRWQPRWEATVYYDNHCWLCTRWIRIIQNFGILVGVKYVGLEDAPEQIKKLSTEHDMWVIQRGRKKSLGYDGFVELLKQSWIGRIFVWLLSWKISLVIGRLIYGIISGQRKFCTLPKPILPYSKKKFWAIIGGIICGISLYSVLGMNLGVMSCGRSWSGFFRTWPLSAASLLSERKTHIFEKNIGEAEHSGWFGENFSAPRKPNACTKVDGRVFDFVENNRILKKLFAWHITFLHSWNFIPRIDQYWGMFAPDPANIDYWLVIDGELTARNDPTKKIERDLWKDYALGKKSNGRVSFEKPEDLHTLSVSDRWRKYVYNLLGEYNDQRFKKYFAESWCRRYNQDENSPYILERFTIYSMSQTIGQNYSRSAVQKQTVWQHCCLKNGCFTSIETAPPVK